MNTLTLPILRGRDYAHVCFDQTDFVVNKSHFEFETGLGNRTWYFWDVHYAVREAHCYIRSLTALRQPSKGGHVQVNDAPEPYLLSHAHEGVHIVPSFPVCWLCKRSQELLEGTEQHHQIFIPISYLYKF